MALGSAFSFSEDSVRKSCIPPTFRKGRTDSAMTMIPIPPSHCRSARHRRMPGGASLRFVRIVEPVVVMPDMDSKKASVKVKLSSHIQKGSAPIVAKLIQLAQVSRKAWRIVI